MKDRVRLSGITRDRSDWALMGGWAAAATAAAVGGILLFSCSFLIALFISEAVVGHSGAGIVFITSIVFSCAAFGAGVGWAQGRVVEAVGPAWQGTGFTTAWWRATALGTSLVCIIFGVLLFLSNRLPGAAAVASDLVVNAALVPGLVTLGVAQWWVLRRYVHWAGLWIPLTIVAWECGVQLSRVLFDRAIYELASSQAMIALGILPLEAEYVLVAVATAGVITGLGMIWLLHRRIHPTQDRPPTAEPA